MAFPNYAKVPGAKGKKPPMAKAKAKAGAKPKGVAKKIGDQFMEASC